MDKLTQNVILSAWPMREAVNPGEKMTFGEELKARRLELELTQAQIAQVLSNGDPDGSPCKRTVEEWEAGRRTPMLVSQEGVLARLRSCRAGEIFCDIPLYGEVPAGALANNPLQPDSFISVPAGRYPPGAFALRVRGDSMIGRGIHNSDVVIVHKREAANGDVVVALVNGENTLKTFIRQKGKWKLRSENPQHEDPVFTDQSIIQAVLIEKF